MLGLIMFIVGCVIINAVAASLPVRLLRLVIVFIPMVIMLSPVIDHGPVGLILAALITVPVEWSLTRVLVGMDRWWQTHRSLGRNQNDH